MALDLEKLVLSGRITARQRDEHSNEWKYVLEGTTLLGESAAAVAKLSGMDKLVFITVYRL